MGALIQLKFVQFTKVIHYATENGNQVSSRRACHQRSQCNPSRSLRRRGAALFRPKLCQQDECPGESDRKIN